MGVRLIVEMLDTAPHDLTPAERLVLVILAEHADDRTRKCWPGIDLISRRSGLTPDAVRRVFQRLRKRGAEVRVPLGDDAGGRSVFSHPGKRTTYRLPTFKSRDDGPPISRDEDPVTPDNGGTVIPEWRDDSPPMPGPASRPSPHEPSKEPSSSSPRQAIVELCQRIEIKDDDEAIRVIEEAKSRSRKPVKAEAAYIQGIPDTHLIEIRDGLRTVAKKAKPPKCDECDPNRMVPAPSPDRPNAVTCCPHCNINNPEVKARWDDENDPWSWAKPPTPDFGGRTPTQNPKR